MDWLSMLNMGISFLFSVCLRLACNLGLYVFHVVPDMNVLELLIPVQTMKLEVFGFPHHYNLVLDMLGNGNDS